MRSYYQINTDIKQTIVAKRYGAKWFFELHAMAVSCRGGEFASRSVCMAATLRRSVISRPVCGGQLSVFDKSGRCKFCYLFVSCQEPA